MMKKIITATLIAFTLMLSGCGDEAGEDRLAAINAVDTGSPAEAIALLEAKVNKTDEDKLILATAYMGKAGFAFTDIIIVMQDAANGGGVDAFDDFKTSVANKSGTTAYADVSKAVEYYLSIDGVTSSPSKVAVGGYEVTDEQLKLAIAFVIKTALYVEKLVDEGYDQGNLPTSGSTEALALVDLAETGFKIALSIAPQELKADVQKLKDNIVDNVNDGTAITYDDLKVYIK